VQTTVLLKTSRESWVEPDLDTRRAEKNPGDPVGPFDVAVAVSDRAAPGDAKPPAPRMVILSSRNLADNRYLQAHALNLDLLMNAVSWLRGREDLTGPAPIPAVVHSTVLLNADPVLKARLVLVPTVMAMLLIITLGLITYVARRD
jgi:hypothetical protein